MPIYEYACSACETKFEHLARTMSDTNAPACPKCGSPKTARALSVFAVSSTGASGSGSAASTEGCCPCGKNRGACGRM